MVEFEIELTPLRGRWLDLVRHHDRCRVDAAQRGLVRTDRGAGQGQRRCRHPDVQPPRRLCQRAGRPDVGSLGGQGGRCGHRVRSGTRKAKDHPGFEAAAAALGNRLTVHNQPNLGGSGGYSRVMYEALKNTDCEQILFMDDDIRVEPDSILRALALNRFAKKPTLVGGQMLNLQEPSHLHVMGEMVDAENFMWTNAVNTEYDHNFAKYPLNDEEHERSRLLHRRIDVDYNGWWMCMIPRQVAEELGQPLPLFIKWDDADYGLRAGEHGYPTVTLPARRSGTWRGATRTTRSTGRRTSICATAWSWRLCTGTETSADCSRAI